MASSVESPAYLPNGSLMRAYFTIADYPFSDVELSQSLIQTHEVLEPKGIMRPDWDEDTQSNFAYWSGNGFLWHLGRDFHNPSEGEIWYMPEQSREGFNRDEERGNYFGSLEPGLRIMIKDILREQAYFAHQRSITSNPAFLEYLELYKRMLVIQKGLFYPPGYHFHPFSPLNYI